MSRLWVSIDAGGTFLDIVAADLDTRTLRVLKLPRHGEAQGAELRQAIGTLAETLGAAGADAERLVIGTTVVTNALVEGRLAKAALVTTDGFGDTLAIGRMLRPASYDLRSRRPPLLVPHERTFEIVERVGAGGDVLQPLDEEALDEVIGRLVAEPPESVAVCLLHSYANPEHERRVGEVLRERTGLPVTLSSELLPVFREFERMTATVVNAGAMPVFARFAAQLSEAIDDAEQRVVVTTSAGGSLPLPEARRQPAATVLSGPAGGVVGAAHLAAQQGSGT